MRSADPVPVLPGCLRRPLWEPFAALLPERPAVVPSHPLGRHRARIPDRVVFAHVSAALGHGSGYERSASSGGSDRTIRRRLHEWAAAGRAEHVHSLALQADEKMISLDRDDLAVDGCSTKAPGGGEAAGRSPVDRGKQGLKRSVVTDGRGSPLSLGAAGANRHDAPLLGPTLAGLEKLAHLPEQVVVHRERGYDSAPARARLADLGFDGARARACPRPFKPGAGRWWNGHTPG